MAEVERTKVRLARALREIGQEELAKRAEAGEFDDYESPHPFPLHVLVFALTSLPNGKGAALADRVKNGEFDGTKEEADAWAASPEGQKALRNIYDSLKKE